MGEGEWDYGLGCRRGAERGEFASVAISFMKEYPKRFLLLVYTGTVRV